MNSTQAMRNYVILIDKYRNEYNEAALKTLRINIMYDPRLNIIDSQILLGYIDYIL